MPYRTIPLVAGEIYHVFNRSVGKQPIFLSLSDYERAVEVMKFYRFKDPPIRYSFYNRLPPDTQIQFLFDLEKSDPLVEIISFCFMPNHFHFLLKSVTENGIVKFTSNFQNSYAKYFNTKRKRSGALFQAMFKAVRMISDEQLVHVSRYIHLNPITSYIIKPEQLENYQWSSYPDYIKLNNTFIKRNQILDFFKSFNGYQKFVLDQVDYQRKLDRIKHLILE